MDEALRAHDGDEGGCGTMLHLMLAVKVFLAEDQDLTATTVYELGKPALNGALVLVPAAFAVSTVHKLMEHREASPALLIDLLLKGGAAMLLIQLLKIVAKANG